jgi:hypothetical protein
MASHLQLILAHPWAFFMCVYDTLAHIILVLLHHILLPHACRSVTFRTEIVRCILGSLISNFWDLFFKAPPGLSNDRFDRIDLGSVPVVRIPPGSSISAPQEKPKQMIMLYAHGGGYMFGEPLMWIAAYERWVDTANARGFHLTVLAVNYRKQATQSTVSFRLSLNSKINSKLQAYPPRQNSLRVAMTFLLFIALFSRNMGFRPKEFCFAGIQQEVRVISLYSIPEARR